MAWRCVGHLAWLVMKCDSLQALITRRFCLMGSAICVKNNCDGLITVGTSGANREISDFPLS